MAKTELLFRAPPVFDDNVILPDYSSLRDHCLRIDLMDLRMMNSAGIKTWVQWTRRFDTSNEVHLLNCPSIFLNIAAIVVGVIPADAHIESLLLRYLSTDDEAELRGLCLRPTNGDRWQLPEVILDPSQNKTYEFDGILTKSLGRLRSEVVVLPEIQLSQISSLGISLIDPK